MAVTLTTTTQNFIGLSGDSKPPSPPAGSAFYETDTRRWFVYDGAAWRALI